MLKRELSTLDVVVVAVEWGHGKRAKVLSDYTFAIRGEGPVQPSDVHESGFPRIVRVRDDKPAEEIDTRANASSASDGLPYGPCRSL